MIFFGSRKSPAFPAKVSIDNIHTETAKMEEKNAFNEEIKTLSYLNLKVPLSYS